MFKLIIQQHFDKAFQSWLKAKGIEFPRSYSFEESPKNIPGDIATNVAMILAKQLGKPPRGIAEELCVVMREPLAGIVETISIAGAGFINLTFKNSFLESLLRKILTEKDKFGKEDRSHEKVLIEFVSANPTGPLHIGHGRGAAIGDSLARIFAQRGYNVQREYYLNDVGNQMQTLGHSLEVRYRQLNGEDLPFPDDGYKGSYITEIAKKIKPAKTGTIDFQNIALKEMLSTIEKDLTDFGVEFDTWFSESKIASPQKPNAKTEVENTCSWLKEHEFAFEKEGALWFASSRFGDDKDRVLKRSDGRFTYLASDIAYHKNKVERGFDKLIDLWGADHHGYVARMQAAMKVLDAPDKLNMILYQLVSLVRNGEPVAMSTRSGEFVTLEEVVKEVGKDACRFFFMLRAPGSHLEFDLELAKKRSSENPVFYVQYVHARCNSLFNEANLKMSGKSAEKSADISLLIAPEERSLTKKLIQFSDTIDVCVTNTSPHYLTTYLMEVADHFHRFYEHHKVVDPDNIPLTQARLALVQATATIVKNGLTLLGVNAPDKM